MQENYSVKISVNSIAPAAIETSLFEGNKPEILNVDLYPLGVGQTEDVANATAFLLQNGARYITGETLILDGGATWLSKRGSNNHKYRQSSRREKPGSLLFPSMGFSKKDRESLLEVIATVKEKLHTSRYGDAAISFGNRILFVEKVLKQELPQVEVNTRIEN